MIMERLNKIVAYQNAINAEVNEIAAEISAAEEQQKPQEMITPMVKEAAEKENKVIFRFPKWVKKGKKVTCNTTACKWNEEFKCNYPKNLETCAEKS